MNPRLFFVSRLNWLEASSLPSSPTEVLYYLFDHRLKKSNEMQQYADIYLLLNYSTSFGAPIAPIMRST